MNKVLPLLMLCALLLTGCGSAGGTNKIGTIKYLNVTEEVLAETYGHKSNPWRDTLKREYVFF